MAGSIIHVIIKNLYIIFISSLLIGNAVGEIFTAMGIATVAGSLMGGSWYKWDTITDNTVCRFTECCNSNHVPYDLDKLQQSLRERMFGQPLVNELLNILSAHRRSIVSEENGNRKALVISLHGWSGVGKNYAATMIAEAIYKKGMQSKYVKLFMGNKDFDCTDVNKTKKELMEAVNIAVKKCPKSLIIFDEIHDMCPSVLDAIKPMLDHHHAVDGVDYRDTIFIFISNIGGHEIATNLLDLYSQGLKRNEVEFHNFEPIIRRISYYTGGFEKSKTIAQNLIDHYIPFLPLEQQHVEMCALSEFRLNGVYNPSKAMMMDALSVITYGPSEDKPIFANNGCKRFTHYIPYVIEKHTPKNKNEEL